MGSFTLGIMSGKINSARSFGSGKNGKIPISIFKKDERDITATVLVCHYFERA